MKELTKYQQSLLLFRLLQDDQKEKFQFIRPRSHKESEPNLCIFFCFRFFPISPCDSLFTVSSIYHLLSRNYIYGTVSPSVFSVSTCETI